jgi:hypothetical protein
MIIQFIAHAHEYLLPDNRLQDIDEIFEQSGQGNRPYIEATVEKKKLFIPEMDGLVNNSFLHFQRKYLEKKTGENNYQQK